MILVKRYENSGWREFYIAKATKLGHRASGISAKQALKNLRDRMRQDRKQK